MAVGGIEDLGLSALVAERRKALGASYRDIAKRSGVSVTTVHKIEQGKIGRIPEQRTLDGLAEALQVDVQVLIRAAAADIGLKQTELADQGAHTIYLASKKLSKAEQSTVLAVINSILDHHEIAANH